MSHLPGQDRDAPEATSERKPWERPPAADDIVDPIDTGAGDDDSRAALGPSAAAADQELSDEDALDVPLEVRFTDALSMLADGGHDYGSTPLAAGEPAVEDDASDADVDVIEIDESSKDA